jgi:hypothetical protein
MVIVANSGNGGGCHDSSVIAIGFMEAAGC